MRIPNLALLGATLLTLLLLVVAAPAQPWAKALLGFQLPALWTLLALVGIFRAVRAQQAVPAALYVALGVTLLTYLYFFLVVFAGGKPQPGA
jgi:hypothetical protein